MLPLPMALARPPPPTPLAVLPDPPPSPPAHGMAPHGIGGPGGERLRGHAGRRRDRGGLDAVRARPPGDEPAVRDRRLNVGAVAEDQRHRTHPVAGATVRERIGRAVAVGRVRARQEDVAGGNGDGRARRVAGYRGERRALDAGRAGGGVRIDRERERPACVGELQRQARDRRLRLAVGHGGGELVRRRQGRRRGPAGERVRRTRADRDHDRHDARGSGCARERADRQRRPQSASPWVVVEAGEARDARGGHLGRALAKSRAELGFELLGHVGMLLVSFGLRSVCSSRASPREAVLFTVPREHFMAAATSASGRSRK